METTRRTTRSKSRSTDDERKLVLKRLQERPNGRIEADSPADAWRQLGLDADMPIGVFKNAISHLAYPNREKGEKRCVTYSRDSVEQSKASRPSYIWQVLPQPA